MSDFLERLGIHPYQAPQPLKLADGFEPTKLFNVAYRLRAWTDIPIESGPLMQVREDVVFLLDHHQRLYKRHEEAERALWYQVGSEGNGNVDISWRERAEEAHAKLAAVQADLEVARVAESPEDMLDGINAALAVFAS